MLNKEYYNNFFRNDKSYSEHYSVSRYLPLWKRVISLLNGYINPKILELGCGTGQFAEMLYDHGYRNYVGIDYSDVGIEMALNRCNQQFIIDDIRNKITFDYDMVLCLETLEHVEHDYEVISNIKKGSHIILTVPSFGAESHARFFKNIDEINDRYKAYIEFELLEKFNEYFIGAGIKK